MRDAREGLWGEGKREWRGGSEVGHRVSRRPGVRAGWGGGCAGGVGTGEGVWWGEREGWWLLRAENGTWGKAQEGYTFEKAPAPQVFLGGIGKAVPL